jgi:putative membrane protein
MKERKKILLFKETLWRTLLITTIVLFGITSCRHPQKVQEHSDARFDINTDHNKDIQFLINVAKINLEGIHLGSLAQQKCIMTDVKELGKMMEKMHRSSLSSLTELAAKKSVLLPTSLNLKARSTCGGLSNQSGINFDKEYCEKMVNRHLTTIAMFEKLYQESNDTEIKEWAISILPLLRKHLNYAIICQDACTKML